MARKQIYFRLPEMDYARLRRLAESDNRTIAQMVETIVKRSLRPSRNPGKGNARAESLCA